MKIAIIGGGISALASAHYLKQEIEGVQISIFERDKELGGKIKSESIEDFIFESGSNGFLSNKEETFEFIDSLKLNDMLLRSEDDSRIRYIFDKNRLHKLPTKPKDFVTTSLLPFTSKLRVLKEYFIKAKFDDSDETLEAFGDRRFGKEFTKVFLDPMSAGVFGSSAKKLSINSAFPRIVQMEREYGSLFKAMKKLKKGGSPSGVLTSFNGGMSQFILALEKKLAGVTIFKNAEVRRVEKSKDKLDYTIYNITFKELDIRKEFTTSFDKVIFATEAFEASKLLVNIDRELANLLAGIEYSPISILGFGYKNMQNSNLNAFGLLTTSRAKRDILGILFDSSIFKDRAKSTDQSIRFMIGGAREPSLAFESKDELISIAKVNAKEILSIDREPDTIFTKLWAKGIPNYTLGHNARVEKIFKRELDGIFLNSNAYRGVSFNDCILNSKDLARRVKESLL